MDTVMNYNNTPNSQILPPSTEKLLPEGYGKIKADGFRGDFLAVAGRRVDDAALMNAFWYHYGRVKSGKKQITHRIVTCSKDKRFKSNVSKKPKY